ESPRKKSFADTKTWFLCERNKHSSIELDIPRTSDHDRGGYGRNPSIVFHDTSALFDSGNQIRNPHNLGAKELLPGSVDPIGVSCRGHQKMSVSIRMLRESKFERRRFYGLFCLLAVVLLQAPFARAAWLSSSMACCMGDHCPITSHHHKPASEKSEPPMDCDHHTTNKTSDCRVSCCKTADETVVEIAQFVVHVPRIAHALETAASQNARFAPKMLSRSEKPKSPPPRTI